MSVTAGEGVKTAAQIALPGGRGAGQRMAAGEQPRYALPVLRERGVPVMAGPQDPAAAGGDRLRAGQADREQVIEALKDAFVHGRLTRDELDARAGRALSARTYADLAALTADIPPGPAAAGPGRPPPGPPGHSRPAAAAGTCVVIAVAAIAAVFVTGLFDHSDPHWPVYLILVAMLAMLTALCIMGCAVFTSSDQRSSGRQLPPGPGRGRGRAATPSKPTCAAAPARIPFPPAPAPTRAAADLRAHKPRQHSSPPERAGHRAASGRRQARYDAGDTGTGTDAFPVAQAGPYVLSPHRIPHDRVRRQAARERAEPVLRH